MYKIQNNYGPAQLFLKEALKIFRQLAKVKSQTYLPIVASTLKNLAILLKAQNEYSQAQTSYEEALHIYRQLADINPQTYLTDVASICTNLATFYLHAINNKKKSLEYCREAIVVALPYIESGHHVVNALQVSASWGNEAINDLINSLPVEMQLPTYIIYRLGNFNVAE